MAKDTRFARSRVHKAVEAMQAATASHASPATPGVASRRRFLQAGAAGALAATLPLLNACGGGGDDGGGSTGGGGGSDGSSGSPTLTLFFDYSHLDRPNQPRSIQVGRDNYRLVPVSQVPDVLARERRTNRFLSQVDDAHITHVATGVKAVASNEVAFQYGVTDGVDGQWTMDSVNLMLPEAGVAIAFERMQQAAGLGAGQAIPLSAKRRKYGLSAARSARDLYEEQALHDSVSHAATLIAMHKDMLALDGAAASTVVNAHVMASASVDDVDDAITQLRSASPEISPGRTNPDGWATLRPLLDANGQPMRIDKPGDPAHGRIVYMPVLHPVVATLLGQAVKDVLPGVQNDATLGADVTHQPAGSTLRGVLWARRDGQPAVLARQPGGAPGIDMAVSWPSGQNRWLECSATATPQGDGSQLLSISYSNIALRYLSCYIEVYDEAGNLLQLGTMPGFPSGEWVTSPPNFNYDRNDVNATRLGIGTATSLGTVMGIPVFTDSAFYGSLNLTLKLSKDVHKVRLYAGGLGTGSNNHSDTIAGGVAGTMIINYILTTMFGAMGAIAGLPQAFSLVTAGGAALINAFANAIIDSEINGNDFQTAAWWQDQGINLLNFVIAVIAGSNESVLETFGEGLAEIIGEEEALSAVEKAIPVVGLILAAESALAAAADFILTTIAIAQSPYTYVTDLVFTHDLEVAIGYDPSNPSFPKAANAMTVIATFDDGNPFRLDFALQAPDYPAKVPKVVFAGAPYGGQVDIAVTLYQKSVDGNAADNILLGLGSTGKLNNDDRTPYAVTVAERAYPIGPRTKYQHVQRSYVDGGGSHVWVQEPAPTTPPSQFACGGPGEICQFNGIAVRQGTSTRPTVLGYAWRGQNLAGGGDVGQQALMNADAPGTGYAIASDARAVAGLDIAFSRTAGGTDNFYVDPTGPQPMIRAVLLDTGGAPSFDGPGSNRSYGMLNLPSDALLAHPSGYLISISGAHDRFEVLRPPAAALTDALAGEQLIAQVMGGSGTLPGKLSNVTAATITKDGSLLMLERGNNRIQALDISCNPVRYFGSSAKTYFLSLGEMPASAGWQHLDIQADIGGLLYVLSTNAQTGIYRLSIYDGLSRLQQALSVTEGVLAARIGLDHWRDLYTMNYQPVSVQGSGNRPAITEPSVSLWTPQAV